MNYLKIYNNIIEKALSEKRNKKNNYFEKHHILPRSLGGNDLKNNIVLLTAREHFICHALLVEIHRGNYNNFCKMLHAFILMKGESLGQKRYMNSRLYNKIKEEYSIIRSINEKGKILSESHNNKISNSLKGKKHSEETKLKISENAKKRIRKPFSDEYKLKMSEIMKNKFIKTKGLRS